VFDAADRMLASGAAAGTAYDAWGRITTLPAGLTSTPVAGDAGASYYANDLVRSVSQLVLDAEGAPTTTSGVRTWTLDPAGRLATMTSTGLGATALTNHYSDPSGDSPTWTADTAADGTVTTRRYLSGPAGYLGEATTTAGTTTTSIGLAGLHGDILRTTTPAATGSPDGPALDVDEFGLITNPDTATTGTGPRYGWLGQHQRATDTGSTGLTLMGVRLYTPTLGRFLSTDPIYGGNENAYNYPSNPVNGRDLDGRLSSRDQAYQRGWQLLRAAITQRFNAWMRGREGNDWLRGMAVFRFVLISAGMNYWSAGGSAYSQERNFGFARQMDWAMGTAYAALLQEGLGIFRSIISSQGISGPLKAIWGQRYSALYMALRSVGS
jgi:RHS repeat-associated protein